MSDANIIRVVKGRQNPYSMIANRPALDKRLSFRARGILWLCLTRPDDWQFNATYLHNMSEREGRDAINSALHELENYQYIFRSQVRHSETQRWLGSIWLVFEVPYEELYPGESLPAIQAKLTKEAHQRFFDPLTENPFTDEEPFTEKPYTEKPLTDEPYTEKPPLLNTESILKTEEAKTEERAAHAASRPTPAQPLLLSEDPDQTTAFNGPYDAIFQEALKTEARADGRRGPQKWGSLAQKQQFRDAAHKIAQKGPDELQRAIAEGLKRERKSRDALVAWLVAWAGHIDKPRSKPAPTPYNGGPSLNREQARQWYGNQ
ncbi:MAG: hypothetical protein JXA21_24070 [Anaerolineae bacterium]|nr:hypothetical protein [Anaerolineae bacterium]